MTQPCTEPSNTTSLSEPTTFFAKADCAAMARNLLDRALLDYGRAEREAQGGGITALYRPEVRWEMVRTARQLLDASE